VRQHGESTIVFHNARAIGDDSAEDVAPDGVAMAAVTSVTAFVEIVCRAFRGRQRGRARVLAAAQRADAAERAQAFGRLLNVHGD
jgi:hypothetical protein